MSVRATSGPRREALPAGAEFRRHKAVTLVEELSIRTQKVQPLMKRLEQVYGTVGELPPSSWKTIAPVGAARRIAPTWEKELKDLMIMTLETPESPPSSRRGHEQPV